MKAVVIERPGVMKLVEMEIPAPPPQFARVKVAACAVCATDLEVLDGNIPARYPLVPGHEWSGVVDAVGSPEDSGWIGRRVTGSNDVVCLRCEACRSGNWRYCSQFEEIGFKRNGAYAEYVLVPAYGLTQLPDSLPFENAALCEPLGVALGTMRKTGAGIGDTALIYGAGSIGLCMLSVCRAMGLRRITVCAASERRLSLARKMGAFAAIATKKTPLLPAARAICPEGYDVVIDATGYESCIRDCIALTRKGGALALAGYGHNRDITLHIDDIHVNNLRVLGAGNNWNQHALAVGLMADGIVDLSPLLTHSLPLERFEDAIALARTRPEGFAKAVFRFAV